MSVVTHLIVKILFLLKVYREIFQDVDNFFMEHGFKQVCMCQVIIKLFY
jgi:hypothetical protein